MRKPIARPSNRIIGISLALTAMVSGAEAGQSEMNAGTVVWRPPAPSHSYAKSSIDCIGSYGDLLGGFGLGNVSAVSVWRARARRELYIQHVCRIGVIQIAYNADVNGLILGLEVDILASPIHGPGFGDASAIHITELDRSTSLHTRQICT